MTRQAAIERSPEIAARWPLLRQAVRLVGHPQIRARGTIGGSVAHADPKAELPVALAALGARFHVRSAGGARTLAAGELFRGPLMTALAPDELLVEIEVPPLPAGAAHRVPRAGAHARRLRDRRRRRRRRARHAGARAARRRLDAGARCAPSGVVGARRAEAQMPASPTRYRRALLAALARRAIEAAA